ncbi:MOSC domain-containing protein [Paenibacillus validus]|uniref:MOSC domain-containing protein n=1 Tax=Paenibacillus TaxID=44249 RepID=UPI000FD8454B|nr:MULTISPECIES: MOSC domain-containing protein [Paenibacillus]MED4603421.1 MOSC domain-containing protein [Paenibacillus validus]MED4608416.1 MOSC domain-containing protein [Paenibacillus validus]
MRTKIEIVSVNVGRPAPLAYQNKIVPSGIGKTPVSVPLQLSLLNLDGDEQADLVHHGGREKAVCVYCVEHYPYWESLTGTTLSFGAFGENVTVGGLTELEAYIGDTFQWGDAIVQISQPRQPCFKLAAKHGWPELPKQVEKTGYTGYYFRVLEEGRVSADSSLQLLERDPQAVTIDYANRIMYRDQTNAAAMERLLQLPALSASWQATFRKRLAKLN